MTIIEELEVGGWVEGGRGVRRGGGGNFEMLMKDRTASASTSDRALITFWWLQLSIS